MNDNRKIFEIEARDDSGGARCGRLHTAHGDIRTPVFMPVGTQGAVKALHPDEVSALGYGILLGNTYHLGLRPGLEVIRLSGGLHKFMGWGGAILTDSGGYQVFSLARRRVIGADGVTFRSHIDGSEHFLGPREAMAIQRELGSDIAMVFDECLPWPCDRDYACQSVSRTLAWAASCARRPRAAGQWLFGIVQGGDNPDLREKCALGLREIGFDGYAVGGVSVGEPQEVLLRGVEHSVAHLPPERPRYLMGVGLMPQIVEAVARGVDMFDCVEPTRLARNGTALTLRGRYPLKAAAYSRDQRPVEEGCDCPVCRRFSRAYMRHLLKSNEILGLRLLTVHNLACMQRFMEGVRSSIREGRFAEYRRRIHEQYRTIETEHAQRGIARGDEKR